MLRVRVEVRHGVKRRVPVPPLLELSPTSPQSCTRGGVLTDISRVSGLVAMTTGCRRTDKMTLTNWTNRQVANETKKNAVARMETAERVVQSVRDELEDRAQP